jgi:hypothetical protein
MPAWIIGMAISLIACPAAAQQTQRDALAGLGLKLVQPMSPAEIAAMRAKVDAALAGAGATAWFENVTDASAGQARHRPSGLICMLGKPGQRLVSASEHDAACETKEEGTVYRISVRRAPADATLEIVAAEAAAVAQQEERYAPYRGPSVTARPKPGSGMPEHRTLRFTSRIDGRERMVRLQVALIRGWILTSRREGPKDTSALGIAEMLQEATFGSEMKAP